MIEHICPLKIHKNDNHKAIVRKILSNLGSKRACFIGDDTGYFFCLGRRVNNPCVSFTNQRSYMFYMLLKDDLYYFKTTFSHYMTLYDHKLLEIFEKEAFTDKDPTLICFKLFIVLNSSTNLDMELSDYVKLDIELLKDKVNKLNQFYFGKNDFYCNEVPDDVFPIIVNGDAVGDEGIIITKQKKDYHVIAEVDDYKYYYYTQ